MSAITLDIPDDLVQRLQGREDQLAHILELGLRELSLGRGFPGASALIELLATLPEPEDVLKLHPSPELQQRIDALLDRSMTGSLTPAEESEWDRYEFLEHLVRIAKASAQAKLHASSGNA